MSSIGLNNTNIKVVKKDNIYNNEKKIKKHKIEYNRIDNNENISIKPKPKEENIKKSFSSLLPKPIYSEYIPEEEIIEEKEEDKNEYIPPKQITEVFQLNNVFEEVDEPSYLPMPKTDTSVYKQNKNVIMYPAPTPSSLPEESRIKYLDKHMKQAIQSEYIFEDISQRDLTNFKYDPSTADGTLIGSKV